MSGFNQAGHGVFALRHRRARPDLQSELRGEFCQTEFKAAQTPCLSGSNNE